MISETFHSEAAIDRADSSALDAWLARIGAERRGGAPGVERLAALRRIAEGLGALPPARVCVVVAGTNGKGSTTAFAEHLLLAAGRAVGAATSPHLHVFNERIRVGGAAASDGAIVAAFEAIERARGGMALSYYEYAALAALWIMAGANLDCAVLEVGLGGRLDAVNVVDADVAVICNVGLDHQRLLGADREAIGAEKAGILRAGRPLVVGEIAPPRSVLARAASLGAPIFQAGRRFGHAEGALWIDRKGARRAFRYEAGHVDAANAATALQAARLAGAPLRQDLVDRAAARARNPGRFEVVETSERAWVLDVAHNPDAARFLAAQMAARFQGRRIGLLVGCLEDKDAAGVVRALRPLAREVAYADTVGERGLTGRSVRDQLGDRGAFAGALADAAAHLCRARAMRNDVILVCGSFDVVERMRIRLKLPRTAAT